MLINDYHHSQNLTTTKNMESSSILFSVALTLITSLLVTLKLITSSSTKNALPPSPPSLPILGHLHHLKKPLHRSLARLSARYGPLLTLRLGSRRVIVLSSLPLARQCFTDNDLAFASRPQLPSAAPLTYNFTTPASAPYGPHWRNIRRIATVELLSSHRLHLLSDVRDDESRMLVSKLFRDSEANGFELLKVELKPRVFGLLYNVMTRMIAGKRYYDEDAEGSREEARVFRELVEESLAFLGVSNLSDFLPVLRWVDFGGVKRKMRSLVVKRELVLQGLIDQQRENKKKKQQQQLEDDESKKIKRTMIEVLMSLQEENPEYYTDDIIKALIVTLLLAGTDTSTDTIEWAMSFLLNHPDKLQIAKREIDSKIGGEHRRLLEEQDLPNLPYLSAIISETLRLCPATPLLVPHESHQECKLGGFTIPSGTMLLVNAWAIHRDPSVWAEPTEFRPERFLNGEEEDGGKKTIPFGMGRRRCPGDGLALRVIGLVLGRLIQCFEWERTGMELVSMEDSGGLTLHKVIPLEALYRPRDNLIALLSHM